MNDLIIKICGVYKHFNGIKALSGFSDNLSRGEILGLIGPNGAGKTTLFNLISGFLTPDKGTIYYKDNNLSVLPAYRIAQLGISRTFQNLRLIRQISVLDNVLLSFKRQAGEHLKSLFFNWKHIRMEDAENRKNAMTLIAQSGLEDKSSSPAEELSYGQQKLLSITCCLAAQSDVLLLDEPIAGIAPELANRILEIIRALPDSGKSVIIIEHDMDAIMRICDRVIFMDAGLKISTGTPFEVKNDPNVIQAYID
jgi:ABC-type branched-subunit amino acid transport system ATPase component